MLTPEGAALLWEIAAGLSDDSLAGGSIVVSDGVASAAATLDTPPAVEGSAVTLIATFGEDVANFEWTTTEVVSAHGVIVDREAKDSGRKAAGAVWTLSTVLELGEGS